MVGMVMGVLDGNTGGGRARSDESLAIMAVILDISPWRVWMALMESD